MDRAALDTLIVGEDRQTSGGAVLDGACDTFWSAIREHSEIVHPQDPCDAGTGRPGAVGVSG